MTGLSHGARRVPLRAFLLCSASLLLVPLTATAQETDLTGGDLTLDQIVVSATGSPTSLRDAPASVTVLTQAEIENTPSQDLGDLLSKVEGITVGHGGNTETIRIRGLGDRHTLFLIDGKRVTSAPNLFRGNDFDSGWVPIDAVERVEIVRGPMSSLYGSDAMGGVINIITKPVSDEWTGSVTADYTWQQNRDAGDSWKTGFYLSGPITVGKLGFKLFGDWSHRDSDSADVNGASQLPGFYESDDRSLDGTVSWIVDENNLVDFDLGYSNREEAEVPLNRLSGAITHYGDYQFGTTEFRIYGDRIENEYGHGNVAGSDQPNTAYNLNIDGSVIMPVKLHFDQTLTVGASYRRQQIDDKYVLTGDNSSSIQDSAAFFEDELLITDDFLLTLGYRLDYNENFGSHSSPRIYGVYHLTDNLTLKGGWSTAFKAPTLLESSPNWDQISCGGGCYLRGSADLEPETSDSFEAGLQFDNGRLSAGATIFRTDLDDMIQFPPNRTGDAAAATSFDNFVGYTASGEPIFTYQNIESARMQGLEAAVSYRVTDAISVNANYTYLDATNLSGGMDRPLAWNPEHSANIGIDWQATDSLLTTLTVNYVGDQYTYVPQSGDMVYATETEAYTTADILASWDFNDSFTARFGVLNIGDKTVTRKVSNDFNVDGRRFYASLTGRF